MMWFFPFGSTVFVLTLLLAVTNNASSAFTINQTQQQTGNRRGAFVINTKFTLKASSTESTESVDVQTLEQEQDTNKFDTILRTRRTINSFEPTLPKNWEQTLTNAIESAIRAPNHKRTEPWRFHLLGPKTIEELCQLNASIVTEKKGEKAGQKKLERWRLMPGWLVVTCQTAAAAAAAGETISMEDPTGLEREDYAACCCAVQNLCLSLHNAGLGTKWTTGPVNFDERFGKIVGFDQDEFVVGTIWFGTPEKIPDAPIKKKSLDNVFIKHD